MNQILKFIINFWTILIEEMNCQPMFKLCTCWLTIAGKKNKTLFHFLVDLMRHRIFNKIRVGFYWWTIPHRYWDFVFNMWQNELENSKCVSVGMRSIKISSYWLTVVLFKVQTVLDRVMVLSEFYDDLVENLLSLIFYSCTQSTTTYYVLIHLLQDTISCSLENIWSSLFSMQVYGNGLVHHHRIKL